jgi:zinc protease
MDRKFAPTFKEITRVSLKHAEKVSLDNGIPLYVINAGTQELAKIDFVFNAGSKFQKNSCQAKAVNSLLTEGTTSKSASQIADELDYYGAFLENSFSADKGGFSLYSLNRQLENVLPIIKEVFTEAVFPENELNIYIQNEKQRLEVNSKKNAFIARKHFYSNLFGPEHPYGRSAELSDYDALKREDLLPFYERYYSGDNCIIVISGKIGSEIIQLMNKTFGSKEWLSGSGRPEHKLMPATAANEKRVIIEKKDALQTALKIGKPLFNRKHTDFHGMLVLNTILGGYFGSRLMKNIREDKGYTYGIHSNIQSFIEDGCFFIETEVNVANRQNAVDEIFKEMQLLSVQPVGAEELTVVKNYLMGSFLRSIDGPFSLAERIRMLIDNEIDYRYYENYVEVIKTISPEQLLQLANKYLTPDSMHQIIVG